MIKIILIILIMLISQKEINIKHRAYNDLYFFTKNILGYSELQETTHKPLCEYIQNTKTNILDLEPRGHFKTTIISIGYSIFGIINNPDIKILINHKILGKAKEILSEIIGHFERNHKFRYFFGDWVGKGTWGKEAIIVNKRRAIYKEPTISISSTEHEATSGHYDLIINDDLVGLKDMYSEAEREATLRYFKTMDYIGETAKIITVGTRWHLDDLYNWIIEKKKSIEIRIRKAIINNRPYFPERFTIEKLKEMREEDIIMFSAQMMNEPIPSETQIFKYDDLRFQDIEKMKLGITYGYIDLAISKKTSADYIAFLIGSKSERINIIDALIGKYGLSALEGLIISKCKEHNIRQLGIEANSFQELFVNIIINKLKENKIDTNIIPIKHTADKILRINSIHGQVIKNVNFRSDWETKYPLLIQQLINFPQGKYDDGPDGLEGLISMFEKDENKKLQMWEEDISKNKIERPIDIIKKRKLERFAENK